MTVFMMYMLGSSLNSIINITMLAAMVANPVRTLLAMNKGELWEVVDGSVSMHWLSEKVGKGRRTGATTVDQEKRGRRQKEERDRRERQCDMTDSLGACEVHQVTRPRLRFFLIMLHGDQSLSYCSPWCFCRLLFVM